MRCVLSCVGLILCAAIVQAQTFSSGSTGADGPATCSNANVNWQVPDSGIFNFTTVSITSCTVTFTPNQRNTPVVILAQGDVVITGSTIRVNASGQIPGPGGFYGGATNQAGFGPGGGAPGQPGQWVGPLSLVPPIGGSGAGGRISINGQGGGGGGAIVIASSTSIQCDGGSIQADGSFSYTSAPEGFGSGGAIRLVANSVTGSCNLLARGNSNNPNHGIVRVEAQVGGLLYTGLSIPSAVLSVINPEIIPTSTTAALNISSIGGFPVFSDAGTRPGTVDVVLPRALTDPIAVAVQGTNIPVGTAVNLNLSGSSGTTYVPGTLAGSFDLSTATLQVSGLDRLAETHLFVFATFDVPQSAALFNPEGPDHVDKVLVQAEPGQPSTMAFLRKDGSRIEPEKVPTQLLAYFSYPNR
jgi:hypothetical protein